LEDLFKIEVGKLVHFHFQRKLRLNLSNLFQPQCNISNRNTRSSKNPNLLYVPLYKTSRLQRCKKYLGVKIWNKILPEIQNSNFKTFKRKYKEHLLQSYF